MNCCGRVRYPALREVLNNWETDAKDKPVTEIKLIRTEVPLRANRGLNGARSELRGEFRSELEGLSWPNGSRDAFLFVCVCVCRMYSTPSRARVESRNYTLSPLWSAAK